MLVLSRRVGERILFPTTGISIQLVRIEGKAVRLGVEAPPDVRVMREELPAVPAPLPAPPTKPNVHELCNRLSKITIGLHLYRRQQAAAQTAQAEATLDRVFAQLETLDRRAVGELVGERPAPATRPPRALLVEDDSNERELLSGLLAMNGCECATAADGQEALDYLATQERPDVVLLDMLMPRCDGRTAVRAIRGNPKTADLRVFAVSGSSPQDLGVPVGPKGVDGWFPKPLNPRTLWDAIRLGLTPPVVAN